MTVLARRNKTRWIKSMKRRGYKWKRGKLWQVFTFAPVVIDGRNFEIGFSKVRA